MKARPGQPDLLTLLAQILYRGGRRQAAARELEKALARRPDFIQAAGFLASLYEELGQLDKAEKAWYRVVSLSPSAPAWFNLGNVLRRLDRQDEAVVCYDHAHKRAPDDPTILSALVARKQALCDWAGLDELAARLVELVKSGRGAGVQPFRMLSVDCAEDVLARCAKSWSARLGATRAAPFPEPMAGKVLTVGYLSADFHSHATAYLAAELFELHDRTKVRPIAYSTGPDDGSDIRRRLEAGFDVFRHLPDWPAAEIAGQMRADGVDILIDLKGHTRDARPDVVALRPAPIQVAYLGYPGSMGLDAVDYILADPVVLPMACQADYTERIIHLPWCYQVNDRQRPRPAAPGRAESGLPAEGPVLACFNAAYKISPALFSIWMRLLAARPDAVLWLLSEGEAVERTLRAEAERRGIAGERLIFAPIRPLREHLARYALADLTLDTLPYNAHTTGSDSLWMGCPLITCRGATFAGRVGASLLHAVGMDELVTETLEDYEARANALLADPAALAALRRRLTETRDTAPLFDTPAFTRAVETALARMWDSYCRGQPPEAFAV